MVYRSYVWYTKQLEDNDEKNLSCVSRLAGRSWMVLSEQARTPFKQVADIAKREHAERNPDYKYAPSSRSQRSQKNPSRRASRPKEKAKAKETATFYDAVPQPKDATPTPTGTPPASSEFSSSSSSSSSLSSPSTPPAPVPQQRALHLPPGSPQLRYPWDRDLPGYPLRPRFRSVTSSLIPSPFTSVLQLNDVHTPSILDELPDVGPAFQSLFVGTNTDHRPEIRSSRVVPRPTASRVGLQRRDSVRWRRSRHADLGPCPCREYRLFQFYFR